MHACSMEDLRSLYARLFSFVVERDFITAVVIDIINESVQGVSNKVPVVVLCVCSSALCACSSIESSASAVTVWERRRCVREGLRISPRGC